MSFRTNSLITITQRPNSAFPNRFANNPNGQPLTFLVDFNHTGVIESTWATLTDNAKIKIPRNIYVLDGNGRPYNWTGANIYDANNNQPPLFMRGDSISVSLGIWYDWMFGRGEGLNVDYQGNNYQINGAQATQFSGYIAGIKNRQPIEIDCEDEMWKLKQVWAPNKYYPGTMTLTQVIQDMFNYAGLTYKVDDLGFPANIGNFRIQNETIAAVLERIKRDGRIFCFFRGQTLRCAGIVYNPVDMQTKEVFDFQQNIQKDSLEYNRKEDLNIAVKAYAQVIGQGKGFNEDGSNKSTRTRLEILVGKINANGDFGIIEDEKSFFGSVVKFPVMGATTKAQLLSSALAYLPKLYYTGFRGSFITFGQPTMFFGQQAILQDNVIPERNGTYLIKGVTTEFGIGGFKQKILLDLRTDVGFTVSQLNAGIAG